jgi:hypothetical protein
MLPADEGVLSVEEIIEGNATDPDGSYLYKQKASTTVIILRYTITISIRGRKLPKK